MFTLHALRRVSCAVLSKPAATRGFGTFIFSSGGVRPTVLGATPAGLVAPPVTVTGVTDSIAARISASPVLQALQVRNGPRDTFDPSHRVRKRRSGFLARANSRTGKAILKRRKLKGRKTLSH